MPWIVVYKNVKIGPLYYKSSRLLSITDDLNK